MAVMDDAALLLVGDVVGVSDWTAPGGVVKGMRAIVYADGAATRVNVPADSGVTVPAPGSKVAWMVATRMYDITDDTTGRRSVGVYTTALREVSAVDLAALDAALGSKAKV